MKAKSFAVLGVLILAAAGAFSMLSSRTLDSHECFVSVTAREMLYDGNWILPTCNGTLRINKTPLSYWLVAGFGKLTGAIDEFTARLPSAIFAFSSVVCLFYFINRFLTFRIAAISATVWVTTLCYFRASHNARPDMTLAFFVTVCFLTFYAAIISQSRREQVLFMLIFWISLSLGMLAKGPAPLTYVFIPLFFYIVVERRWRIIPKLLPVVGTIIFLAIVLPWPLAIAHNVNWSLTIWKLEFVDRLVGEYAPGHYPIYYYFLILFKYITPWFILLPTALVAPFYSVWNKKQPVMKFLWFWFAAGFVFLTIDVGKRQHYLLPLMPAVAVLIGIIIEDMVFVKEAFVSKTARNILLSQIAAIIAFIIANAIFITLKAPSILTKAVLFGIIAVISIIVAGVLLARAKPAAACAVGFTGIVIWVTFFNTAFWIVTDVDRFARDFTKTVVGIVPKSDKLVAYQHASTRFVQYYGTKVPEIMDISELYKHYEQGDWIVCNLLHINELSSDKRFHPVYTKTLTDAPDNEKEDAGGALFHKIAPVLQEMDKTIPLGRPISPKGE